MAAEALEQSALEGKDKDQLLQIAKALGVKGVSKLKKAELVDKIIDSAGGPAAPTADDRNGSNGAATPSGNGEAGGSTAAESDPAPTTNG
ncbi:MAG: Rho termination factor N-terminal domain-containing protein, partial [Actinomycetota bacterium]